ncbi:hypothetical protein AB1Y20_010916 [Prymnesium parvum]|uniref:Prokaryotic-type class I peptide chain release factors domain-containing protein n=1 Tax=Prymnesium parvum TaxID=97485 RepID=A0AB34IS32_PRYPA
MLALCRLLSLSSSPLTHAAALASLRRPALAAPRLSTSSGRAEIPRDLIDVSFVRSSGPGGQNVNKLSTKAVLRVDLARAAAHLPPDLLARLREQERARLTTGGELLLQCDEERSQQRNLKLALARLQAMVDRAAVVPKERVVSEEPPERVKEARRREKRQHALKKKARRLSHDY